jgi:hypothetical protein
LTEGDINNSTMCSVRAHEILRDTMYPKNVSVEGSDSYVKENGQSRIEAEYLGSSRKDTIGPKYCKVTLTGGNNEANSLQARLPNIRPGLLPPLLGPLSIHLGPVGLRPPEGSHLATNHQRVSWPNDRPVITLKTTRNEPETQASGKRIHHSNRQGEPPPHTESGDPHRPKGFRTPPRTPLPAPLVKPGTPGT